MKKLTIAAALVCSGCVSSPQSGFDVMATQKLPSAQLKKAIVAYIKDNYFDPYSIRDAQISNQVRLGDTGLDAVCIRMNAKNRMGGYTGMQNTSLRIKNEYVVGSLNDAPACADPRLNYQPFHEVENL